MKILWALSLLLILSLAALPQTPLFRFCNAEPTQQSQNAEHFGPRVDNLLIKVYNGNQSRLQQELETGEIDVGDQDLTRETIDRWSQLPHNETIAMEKHPRATMIELDLNNNETLLMYPNWRSPTNYTEFRHAIAHSVNKTKATNEILQGYGMEMSTPVFPWSSEWFNPEVDPHPYNPETAATILDAAGFVQGSTPNPNYTASRPGSAQYIRVYPSGHQKARQNLDTLVFYTRYDIPARLATARMIEDELLSLGIPIQLSGPIRTQELEQRIWVLRDFHLFIGGWLLSAEPDYLPYLYHSSMYWSIGKCPNYNHVWDAELDHWLEIMNNTDNLENCRNACFQAQRRLAEMAGIVPLWCDLETKAYRKMSPRAPQGWTGIINEDGFGTDSLWTFLNIHRNDSEQGGTVNYGLTEDVMALNPVFSEWYSDWLVLNKIYDSLLTRDPYTMEAIPWMAKSWQIKDSKIIFHLREDIRWHDGISFTSEDVQFSFKYIKSCWDNAIGGLPMPAFYYYLSAVLDVDALDPYTVVVHTSGAARIWDIYNIGYVPIVPKHIWGNISRENATEFAPDPNLIGTGPFKFVEYQDNDHVLLESNADYFRYCPVNTCIEVESHRVEPDSVLNYNASVVNCFSDRNVTVRICLYFDGTPVENRTMALEPNTLIQLGTYATEPLAKGLHKIEVEYTADPYLNRTCHMSVCIWATIAEDVNLNFNVDIKDLYTAAKAFGSYPGYSNWNGSADINGDNRVDLRDYYKICSKFGKL